MRLFPVCLSTVVLAASAAAAPLSKELEIDFFREVPARNLKGITVRADGRLLDGPAVSDLAGAIGAELLWSMAPSGQSRVVFVGTGPEGKIFRVDASAPGAFTAELAGDLEATHVFAVVALRDGALLAGTSPQGTLSLLRSGKVVAAVNLPVDSILDLALHEGSQPFALVATGNPGRIYRIDLTVFAAAGVNNERVTDPTELAKRGITLFGEIRDRNVRRLLRLPGGRVIAGSAPRGNVYEFPATGGAPLILLESRDAEVSDLLAGPDDSFYAALTLSAPTGDTRLVRRTTTVPGPAASGATPVSGEPPDTDDTVRPERFNGRGQLVFFPAGGLPETLVTRPNTAFYRLAWHQDGARQWIIVSGGEQGELLAYSPAERRSMNLGATASAQTNGLSALGSGVFLLQRNNAPGFSLLDFNPSGPRILETRRLDLGSPAELGRLRFGHLRGLTARDLEVSARTSFGSDELEGWTAWTPLTHTDGGWTAAAGLRGRYVQFRLTLPSGGARSPLIDRATLHYLPQNRRPLLTDFRLFSPNLGLIPAPEPPPPANTTLGNLIFPNPRDAKDDPGAAKRRSAFMNSQVVPQAGAQLVYWTLSDPDEDNLTATFSICAEDTDDWTDLAVQTTDTYVQFDTTHLAEGRYRTRLQVQETAPRPAGQRLSYTFETDSLVVDRTAPEILAASATRSSDLWRLAVEARDAASLLEGAEFILNNGLRIAIEQPEDGVRDGLRETFVAEIPLSRAAGATAVEIVVYDAAGNSSARRLPLAR